MKSSNNCIIKNIIKNYIQSIIDNFIKSSMKVKKIAFGTFFSLAQSQKKGSKEKTKKG